MSLSNDELVSIVKAIRSVDYYETIEFLIDNHIVLDDDIDLMFLFLYHLRTPTTKKQQQIQFKIIKKLIQYPKARNCLKSGFYYVIKSLNVQLVDFCINEFDIDIDIDGLLNGYSVLQLVCGYLNKYPNKNIEFAYEMFDYLISIGADLNKTDNNNKNVFYYLNLITNQTIKNKLNEIIKKHEKDDEQTKRRQLDDDF